MYASNDVFTLVIVAYDTNDAFTSLVVAYASNDAGVVQVGGTPEPDEVNTSPLLPELLLICKSLSALINKLIPTPNIPSLFVLLPILIIDPP